MGILPLHIAESTVLDIAHALDEIAELLPNIPYKMGLLDPKSLKAVARAIRAKTLKVGGMFKENGLGASFDSKDKGPMIIVPLTYVPRDIFWRSVAVHEGIHRAVDGMGRWGGKTFQITLFENEFIAHLGQACYALKKGADIESGMFTRTGVEEAKAAALSLIETG